MLRSKSGFDAETEAEPERVVVGAHEEKRL
jgi:hypothetical protein